MSKKNNVTLVGLNNQDNDLFGAFGDDHLTGGNNAVSFTSIQNLLVGDAQEDMLASEKGGRDTLIGGNSSTDVPNVFEADVVNILYGDAAEGMSDFTHGGRDTLIGGNISGLGTGTVENDLFGDAHDMFKSSSGGNDLLTGGDNTDHGFLVFNNLFGDARNMFESSRGGNDLLTGGDNGNSGEVINAMFGDAGEMNGTSEGGNDTLIGGNNTGFGTVTNQIMGDANALFDSARGGNDTLIGGTASLGNGFTLNQLFGDGVTITGSVEAGNDILVAGTQSVLDLQGTVRNEMWGDAQFMSPDAIGGQDTFVFKDDPAAGMTVGQINFILDFNQSQHDVIAFGIPGVTEFGDLIINTDTQLETTFIRASYDFVDVEVALEGFTGTLTAQDFLFI
jgi:hypothetical protein